MLEVGVTNTQGKTDCGAAGKTACAPLSVIEGRTHFFAWSIVSAPLIIGMDFSDAANLKAHWDTISNVDAIEVCGMTPLSAPSLTHTHTAHTHTHNHVVVHRVNASTVTHMRHRCGLVGMRQVNQDYAGFSGSLFASANTSSAYTPCSWWSGAACKFADTMSLYKPLSGRDTRGSTM